MGAMLGVVLSDNLIILYLFWELTSFSSFYLSHFGEKKHQFMVRKITNYYRSRRIKLVRRNYPIIVSRPYIQHSNDD